MNFLQLLGLAAAAFFFRKVLNLVRQLTRPAKDLKSFGQWTVISGATSGIGKSIALELARQGQNILILGRSKTKLDDVVQEIKKESPKAQVETLEVDLSTFHADKALQDKYILAISTKDVGILINNAGLAYPYTNYFHEVDQSRLENMVFVNSLTATLLMQMTISRCFLRKKSSAIINISSAGSVLPHPFHVVYSATKAYLNKISLDLASEYESKGIAVQAQMPYFVESKMSRQRKSLTVPSADQYAKAAVKQIGYSGVLSPYPVHALLFFVFDLIPQFVMNKVVYSMHWSIKKKGDKKYKS